MENSVQDERFKNAKLIAAASAGVLALTPTHAQAAMDIGRKVKLAGDLRTFTQRMALSAAFVMLDVEKEHFLEVLSEEFNLFEEDVHALRNGDAAYDMPPEDNKLVLEAINTVEFGWKVLGPALKHVVDTGVVSDADFHKIESTNTKVMTLTDSLIHRVMFEYKDKIPQELAYQIDIAGTQRMLSQKMIKEGILIALEFEAEAHHEMLVGSLERFKYGFDKLAGLMLHNEVMLPPLEGENATQLEKASAEWKKLRPILEKLDATHEVANADLVQLAKESDVMMDAFGAISEALIRKAEMV